MEIKEYHFHTYFYQSNEQSLFAAEELFCAINRLYESKEFVAITHNFNIDPIGPHPIGSFETWVPQEYFAIVYQWFLLNRNGLSVLIHPITRNELDDHTTHATWMGLEFPLEITCLNEQLETLPIQYPHLKLGYSAF